MRMTRSLQSMSPARWSARSSREILTIQRLAVLLEFLQEARLVLVGQRRVGNSSSVFANVRSEIFCKVGLRPAPAGFTSSSTRARRPLRRAQFATPGPMRIGQLRVTATNPAGGIPSGMKTRPVRPQYSCALVRQGFSLLEMPAERSPAIPGRPVLRRDEF
jgi:hypothetical protein